MAGKADIEAGAYMVTTQIGEFDVIYNAFC